jgi:hypothetical protein
MLTLIGSDLDNTVISMQVMKALFLPRRGETWVLKEKVASVLQLLFAHLYRKLEVLNSLASLGCSTSFVAWVSGCVQGLPRSEGRAHR